MDHVRTHWKKYLTTAALAYVTYQYGPGARDALVAFLTQIGLAY